MVLNERSRDRLQGVHPKLVAVVKLAATMVPTPGGLAFIVTEGLRTQERQKQLVQAGASRTMASRHLTGHAVDLAATVSGEVRWDWPLYIELAMVMGKAAESLGVALTWGGSWKSFPDGPHFEINPETYPWPKS